MYDTSETFPVISGRQGILQIVEKKEEEGKRFPNMTLE